MNAPLRIDASTTLDDETDFAELVRRRLSGHATFSRDDVTPLEPFERFYRAAEQSPYAAPITRAVGDCLTDTDPLVRGMAALFFQRFPTVDGAERVEETLRQARALYAGVPRPWDPSSDLERELLRALAARVREGVASARAAAYVEVLMPGNALPIVGALAERDPTWVATHAEEIVKGTPTAGTALLNALQHTAVDVGDVGVRVAATASSHDPTFAERISQWIEDVDARKRILNAIPHTR